MALNRIAIEEIKFPAEISHPCLLFNSAQIKEIRSRRFKQPYDEWYDNIITTALSYNFDSSSSFLSEIKRSRIAKMNAFSWFLSGNRNYLKETRLALSSISEIRPPTTGEGGNPGEGWGDWMEAAEALKNFAIAYDLIFPELNRQEQAYIEKRMSDKIAQIHKYYLHFPDKIEAKEFAFGLGIPKNNHIIQISSDIAAATLVLNVPKAKKWFDNSITELQTGLSNIMKDGTYKEGPYYARFINYHLFPFFFYISNICNNNLSDNPRIQKLNDWLLNMEMPDGSLPLVDDSFDENLLYLPIGIGLAPQSREMRYVFQKTKSRFKKTDTNWVEAFCAYQNNLRSRKPDYQHFYPDGGYAIFRGKDEIVGTLVSEPDRNSISYHDHIESTAFTCFAYDHHFLIDSGYGPKGVNDKNRNWFTSARAHNIPLINGSGPDQNPVWGDDITSQAANSFSMKNLTSSTVITNYQETDVHRNVWLVNEDFFVVYDRLRSDEKQRFSIPWHGKGDFTKSKNNKVAWKQSDAELRAEFLSISEKPISLKDRIGLNSFADDNDHHIAQIYFPTNYSAELVSIFIPEKTENPEILIKELSVNSNGKIEARTIENFNSGDLVKVIIAESNWRCADIESDAKCAIIQENCFSKIFSLKSVTYLKIADETIFEADQEIDLTFNFANSYGYLETGGNNIDIKFHQINDPGIIILERLTVDYDFIDEEIHFKTNRSGVLQFGRIKCDIETAQPVRDDLPILMQISSSYNPDEEFHNLNYYQKTQLRNEIINYSAPLGISLINQKVGKSYFLQNLYKLSTGFLRSSYNSDENFEFNFPQSFRLKRRFGKYLLEYYEAGFYTEEGPVFRKHRLWISQDDKSFYYAFDNDFENFRMHSFQVQFNRYFSRFDWQKYKAKNAYQIELRRDHNYGFLDLIHSKDKINNTTQNRLTMTHKELATEFFLGENNDQIDYNYSIKRIGHNHSFNIDSRIADDEGLQELAISNSNQISKGLHISSQFIWDDQVDFEDKTSILTNIYSKAGNLNNTATFSKDHKSNYKLCNRLRFPYKNCMFTFHSQIDSTVFGQFEMSFRDKNISGQIAFNKGNRVHLAGNYKLNFIWNLQSELINDLDNEYDQFMFGFFYNDLQRLGLQLLYQKDFQNFWGFAQIVELNISKEEYLNLFAEFLWNENGNIQHYEIDISQTGKSISPGILITHDDEKLLRCEGYICYRF
ncbi:MAG: heparinase II/III-family protein [Candidatus Cloacimonetes bacterium]|nr:heparinase II/III-family protein [Candidatus Cloacimonadota bacterium]MCF7867854.1 heparinase II/III-family protein [Candidatus Cloacimonadota bacterium]MCF7884292.1 heparinase II/III-family protein [Candidatus Cloacimonadota bacterium]